MKNTINTINEMNELLSHSPSYCAIDENGNLQDEADENTMYIIDTSADEQQRHHDEEKDEFMVIMDRDGSNFYATTVNRWW